MTYVAEIASTKLIFNFPVYAVAWRSVGYKCHIKIGTKSSNGSLIRLPLELVTRDTGLVRLLSSKKSGIVALDVGAYLPDVSDTLLYEKDDSGLLWVAHRDYYRPATRHLIADVIEFYDHCSIRSYRTESESIEYNKFVADPSSGLMYMLRMIFLNVGGKFVSKISYPMSKFIQLIEA